MGTPPKRLAEWDRMGSVGRPRYPSRALPVAPAVLLGLLAGMAEAHEIIPGVTGFASLLLHPFVAVETALVMVGLALVTGAAESWRGLIFVCVIVLVGACAGVMLQPSAVLVPGLWRLPLLLALLLGIVAALGRSTAPSVLFVPAVAVSVVVGLAVPPEHPGFSGRLEAVAAVASAVLAVLLVIAVPRVALARFRIVQVTGQIAGAWIFAIALLGIAIWFR